MDRSDVQISTSIVRVREDGGGGVLEFVEFTGNAAEGVNQGLELSMLNESMIRPYSSQSWALTAATVVTTVLG